MRRWGGDSCCGFVVFLSRKGNNNTVEYVEESALSSARSYLLLRVASFMVSIYKLRQRKREYGVAIGGVRLSREVDIYQNQERTFLKAECISLN